MAVQIKRLSAVQNGKVFGVLMALSSAVFLLPMSLLMQMTVPAVDAQGNPIVFPMMMFWIAPILYLVVGFIFTAIGCLIYNFIFRLVGGFEFELSDEN